MRQVAWLILLGVLAVSRAGFTATKDSQPPDKEMLRMMDFLREMELIKQAEMMQDLSQVGQIGDQRPDPPARKPVPPKRKEVAK